MKIYRIIAVALLTTGIVLGAALSSSAQEKANGNKAQSSHKGHGFGRLELTKEQKAKIYEQKITMQKECMNLRNQLAEKQAHLRTISMVDQPDMTAINKTIDEIFALKTDIAKKHAAFTQETRKVLTPEQRLKFDQLREKRGMGGYRHHQMGAGYSRQGNENCCQAKGSSKNAGYRHHGKRWQNDDENYQNKDKDGTNKSNTPDVNDKK